MNDQTDRGDRGETAIAVANARVAGYDPSVARQVRRVIKSAYAAAGLVVLALGALTTTGCDSLRSRVEGEVRAQLPEVGAWKVVPDSCRSGEPMDFFGVDLIEIDANGESIDRLVRLIEDPVKGQAVVVRPPTGPGELIFDSNDDECERFEVTMTRTDVQINNIWNMEGRARIECQDGDEVLSVDVAFEQCH